MQLSHVGIIRLLVKHMRQLYVNHTTIVCESYNCLMCAREADYAVLSSSYAMRCAACTCPPFLWSLTLTPKHGHTAGSNANIFIHTRECQQPSTHTPTPNTHATERPPPSKSNNLYHAPNNLTISSNVIEAHNPQPNSSLAPSNSQYYALTNNLSLLPNR